MRVLLGETEAARVGREIRAERSGSMQNRRAIATLATAASVPLAWVALWQIGAVKQLPDLPLPLFDAAKVNGSGEAYRKLGTGDAFLGIGSYVATATLAAMGPVRRPRSLAWALAAKVIVDALVAGKLTADQWIRYRAFCLLCLVSAGATMAMVPYALAELRRSGR